MFICVLEALGHCRGAIEVSSYLSPSIQCSTLITGLELCANGLLFGQPIHNKHIV